MGFEEKNNLEREFDKELTEGEAAEIKNTKVVHTDDKEFYEGDDDTPVLPTAALLGRINGT